MKKITYVLLLSICFSFTQTEDSYQMTITKISDAYNAKDANSLFGLFSSDLQSSFTLDKVTSFITDNQAKKGTMGESSFLMDDDGNKRYLMEFENSSTILVLGLSSDNKITHLSLEEY
ncbi:hypothetical protein SAMN04487910_4730 [Aquimarina amphilecti]|uniref:DUF3887 domain-containing protein n=2 Tax=Aquimarina TaxID=290174 RepID=A0A1H7XF59_AQUAM|nr:hypothetical protein [Aquimarina amphilecti]SEM32254.1 hypothetical protein SAMN04487910_4730 [Aquimarina amphilecti]